MMIHRFSTAARRLFYRIFRVPSLEARVWLPGDHPRVIASLSMPADLSDAEKRTLLRHLRGLLESDHDLDCNEPLEAWRRTAR